MSTERNSEQMTLPQSVIDLLQQRGVSALITGASGVYFVKNPLRFGTSFVKKISELVNVETTELEEVVPGPEPTPEPDVIHEAWLGLVTPVGSVPYPLFEDTAVPQGLLMSIAISEMADIILGSEEVNTLAITIQSADRRVVEGLDEASSQKFINGEAVTTTRIRPASIAAAGWKVDAPTPSFEIAAREAVRLGDSATIPATVHAWPDSVLIIPAGNVESIERMGTIIVMNGAIVNSLSAPVWSFEHVVDGDTMEERLIFSCITPIDVDKLYQSSLPIDLFRYQYPDTGVLVDDSSISIRWGHRYKRSDSTGYYISKTGDKRGYLVRFVNGVREVLCHDGAHSSLQWAADEGSPQLAEIWELENITNPYFDANQRARQATVLRRADSDYWLGGRHNTFIYVESVALAMMIGVHAEYNVLPYLRSE